MLGLVDRVLGDLAVRGGMYLARRADEGDAETMVIQTGEEGRHRVRLPDLSSSSSVERFVAEAQAHLMQVFARPLPQCPLHDHALRGVADGGTLAWVCPEGAWRCGLGEYEDRNWPPAIDERPGAVAQALVARFGRRGLDGWQSAGASVRDGVWVGRVRLWPMDESLIDQLREASAPIALQIEAGRAPPSQAELQKGVEGEREHDLRWARWAVECWCLFPIDQQPRPIVLVGAGARPDYGFATGEAKLAFVQGLIKTAVPLPERVLVALGARRAAVESRAGRVAPMVITAATRSEAIFPTDRGPRTIPAWELTAEGVNGSIWVADPERPSLWEPDPASRPKRPFDGSPHRSISAVVEADQLILTVSFTGSPTNVMSYAGGTVIESDTAVAIVPAATYVGPAARFRTAAGQQREVTVHLDRPLGPRVLVDLDATPAEVLHAD